MELYALATNTVITFKNIPFLVPNTFSPVSLIKGGELQTISNAAICPREARPCLRAAISEIVSKGHNTNHC